MRKSIKHVLILWLCAVGFHSMPVFAVTPEETELANQCAYLRDEVGAAACQKILQSGRSLDKQTLIETNRNLAVDASRVGQFDVAITALRTVLELVPKDFEAAYNLGSLLEITNQTAEAQKIYTLAVQIKPESAAAHDSLGITLGKLGQHEDALKEFQTAVLLNPRDGNSQYNLGFAYESLGKINDAINAYQNALTIFPNDANAHYQLGTLQLSGQRAQAMNHLKRAIEIWDALNTQHSGWLDANPEIKQLYQSAKNTVQNKNPVAATPNQVTLPQTKTVAPKIELPKIESPKISLPTVAPQVTSTPATTASNPLTTQQKPTSVSTTVQTAPKPQVKPIPKPAPKQAAKPTPQPKSDASLAGMQNAL